MRCYGCVKHSIWNKKKWITDLYLVSAVYAKSRMKIPQNLMVSIKLSEAAVILYSFFFSSIWFDWTTDRFPLGQCDRDAFNSKSMAAHYLFRWIHVLSIYSRFLLIISELSSYNSIRMEEDMGINGRNNDQKVTRTYEYQTSMKKKLRRRKEKEEATEQHIASGENRLKSWVCVWVDYLVLVTGCCCCFCTHKRFNERLPMCEFMSVRIFLAFQAESRQQWIMYFSIVAAAAVFFFSSSSVRKYLSSIITSIRLDSLLISIVWFSNNLKCQLFHVDLNRITVLASIYLNL